MARVAYQSFIDLLTNSSKTVNSVFLQVYTALSDAPDPYPLLELSVDSMLVSEDTLPKLTEENSHLQKNVSKLTSQLEETETRLESERAARKELEDNLESKVKEVEESWTAVLEEKKDNWASKEKALEEKVESQERLISEIKASHEVNARLGRTAEDDSEQANHVTAAEVEMLNSDLERTSARLAEMEARNEQLRIDLAHNKSQATTQAASLEDDPGYMRMRTENRALLRKLDAARVEREGIRRELDGKVKTLERESSRLKEERDSLKTKVQKWSDYENVKQELEVLKSIEFSTGDDDEPGLGLGGGVTGGEEEAERAKGGDTLERLLLARNKKLGDELTILRVSHQDLQGRLQGLQEELSRTNGELDKAQRLNEKLEDDLANMQAEAPNAFPSGASVAGTYVSRFPASSRKGGRISPTSSIIGGLDSRGPSLLGENLGGGGGAGGGSGILPMITAQRDRFKKRNAELEQELSDTHRSVSQLRQEIAALQKDNLNLYEKTRYISTYNRGSGGSGSTSLAYPGGGGGAVSPGGMTSPNPSTIAMGIPLDRYRRAYESNISPFAAFRGRESARAYKRMSLPERVVYSVTRMVLASRTSRNLFAAYCVALHVLVFLSLYWMGADDVDKHASNLGQAAAAAGVAGKVAEAAAAAAAGGKGEWHEAGDF